MGLARARTLKVGCARRCLVALLVTKGNEGTVSITDDDRCVPFGSVEVKRGRIS